MSNGFFLRNQWFFKLPDPFKLTPYYPLAADTLAEHLDISHKTALRICQDQRSIKRHELIYLQIMIFGMIPDKTFMRFKWFFRDGMLLSHTNDLQIDMADTSVYALLRHNHHLQLGELRGQLKEARLKIQELEKALHPDPVEPTNIIKFSDFFTPG